MVDSFTRQEDRGSAYAQVVVRIGLAVAFVLMSVGLAVHVVHGGTADAVRYREMLSTGEPGDRIMTAGALVLALTPAAQIVVLLVDWWRLRDLRYAGVAALVIVMLAIGALLGAA